MGQARKKTRKGTRGRNKNIKNYDTACFDPTTKFPMGKYFRYLKITNISSFGQFVIEYCVVGSKSVQPKLLHYFEIYCKSAMCHSKKKNGLAVSVEMESFPKFDTFTATIVCIKDILLGRQEWKRARLRSRRKN